MATEDRLASARADVERTGRLDHQARWSVRDRSRVANATAAQRAEELRWEADDALERRRAALRDLLAREDAALRAEAGALLNRPAAERRAELAQRARAMHEAREERRKAEADRLLLRAFRENYDPIRAEDSRALAVAAARARDDQVVRNREARAREAEEKAALDANWAAQKDAMDARHAADKRREADLARATAAARDEQVERLAARRAREAEEKRETDARLAAGW